MVKCKHIHVCATLITALMVTGAIYIYSFASPVTIAECRGYQATKWVDHNKFIQPDNVAYNGILKGTDANDVLVGSEYADRIEGLKGNDIICGLGGDDVIIGGEGDDKCEDGDYKIMDCEK